MEWTRVVSGNIFMLSMFLNSFAVGQCPESWTHMEGSGTCYFLSGSNDRRNYENSRVACIEKQGELASVSDHLRSEFILFSLLGKDRGDTWVGLWKAGRTDGSLDRRRSNWVWLAGHSYNWNNWYTDNYSDEPTGEAGCARIRYDGFWGDTVCENKFHYICEKPATLLSATTSTTTLFPRRTRPSSSSTTTSTTTSLTFSRRIRPKTSSYSSTISSTTTSSTFSRRTRSSPRSTSTSPSATSKSTSTTSVISTYPKTSSLFRLPTSQRIIPTVQEFVISANHSISSNPNIIIKTSTSTTSSTTRTTRSTSSTTVPTSSEVGVKTATSTSRSSRSTSTITSSSSSLSASSTTPTRRDINVVYSSTVSPAVHSTSGDAGITYYLIIGIPVAAGLVLIITGICIFASVQSHKRKEKKREKKKQLEKKEKIGMVQDRIVIPARPPSPPSSLADMDDVPDVTNSDLDVTPAGSKLSSSNETSPYITDIHMDSITDLYD